MRDVSQRKVEQVESEFPSTAQWLLEKHGPLMGLADVAQLLGRSPAGVRVGMYSDSETSAFLGPAKIKIGRRLYFRTAMVGAALDAFGAASS